ncbi:uroporphyrinogen-III synthase [Nesterenkonia populi]|uniref:uroporphyrinogen-III synthase n=1 Tax=Nesterenkonia populi TaxID=1591087 RepID=UPI001478C42C|nr:uroporphyrinogen-III synthase [Nesterenkonia populi]
MVRVRIVLTRSSTRSGRLEAGLAEAGFDVAHLPLTEQVLPEETGPLTTALLRLGAGEFQWLLLTSGNTVRFLLDAGWGGTVPAGTRIGVVGPGTAHTLAELTGITERWMPQDHSADGILTEFAQTPEAAALFLPQAARAQPQLAEGLRSRGWDVTQAAAYDTVPVDGDLPWTPGPDDVVLLTASSAAKEWHRRGLTAGTVLAIGEPTARTLRDLRAPADAVLPEPTAAGVLAALNPRN